jgi:hypothetical protein
MTVYGTMQVKEVPNGDSLVIMGNVASGPPPEKRITLASLVAPRLVRTLNHARINLIGPDLKVPGRLDGDFVQYAILSLMHA